MLYLTRVSTVLTVLGLGTVAMGIVAALSLFGRVEVDGFSMYPTLLPGDRLIVYRTRKLAPGDIVVAVVPDSNPQHMVKRLAEIDRQGAVLLGDNTLASTDSRNFGPVPLACLKGKVVYRYFPLDRSGLF
ncbi:MAG: nickel-type superoxide dismutase maturation protease [Actinobacteria bacterium]|nr:nickel-type superoxide dismutase maturation protease [Actinomycetota bacterium]MCL6094558.1 nickel-type superoxide dismutase maturation protease [Actinomycetota bacterium]